MDLQLVNRALNYSNKKKKWLILFAAFGLSTYGAYKVYNSPSIVKKRNKFFTFFKTLVSLAELVSDSAETVSIISKDLNHFLQSESDEIPNSLKQIAKIAASNEFSHSFVKVTESLTVGLLRGYRVENASLVVGGAADDDNCITNRLVDKIFSKAGTGFVSVVVGSFARNLVLGFYAAGESENGKVGVGLKSSSSDVSKWVNVVCQDKSKELIAECIQKFVSTAVAVYLDKTMGVNSYDDFFSGITNPKHQSNMRDILVSVCNGAVETLVKTSHQVLTTDLNEHESVTREKVIEQESVSKSFNKGSSFGQGHENGWVEKVSSTLAVPSNRKFVRDVTGRVTYETIRSFVEFLVWKLSDSMKTSVHTVQDGVVDKGKQVVRYVGAKSSVIVTVCLALYLHILGSSRVLMTA
ncbi:hypothetical protein ACFE04_004657 [Oxalis oulophora]